MAKLELLQPELLEEIRKRLAPEGRKLQLLAALNAHGWRVPNSHIYRDLVQNGKLRSELLGPVCNELGIEMPTATRPLAPGPGFQAPRSNLNEQLTELCGWVKYYRCVTLSGQPGSGRTRLARELYRRRPVPRSIERWDDIQWVRIPTGCHRRLASYLQGQLELRLQRSALNADEKLPPAERREEAARNLFCRMWNDDTRPCLLVFDLPDEDHLTRQAFGTLLRTIIQQHPTGLTRFIVTSETGLGIPGERQFPLPTPEFNELLRWHFPCLRWETRKQSKIELAGHLKRLDRAGEVAVVTGAAEVFLAAGAICDFGDKKIRQSFFQRDGKSSTALFRLALEQLDPGAVQLLQAAALFSNVFTTRDLLVLLQETGINLNLHYTDQETVGRDVMRSLARLGWIDEAGRSTRPLWPFTQASNPSSKTTARPLHYYLAQSKRNFILTTIPAEVRQTLHLRLANLLTKLGNTLRPELSRWMGTAALEEWETYLPTVENLLDRLAESAHARASGDSFEEQPELQAGLELLNSWWHYFEAKGTLWDWEARCDEFLRIAGYPDTGELIESRSQIAAECLYRLSIARTRQDEFDAAWRDAANAEQIYARLSDWRRVAMCEYRQAVASLGRGQHERALELLAQAKDRYDQGFFKKESNTPHKIQELAKSLKSALCENPQQAEYRRETSRLLSWCGRVAWQSGDFVLAQDCFLATACDAATRNDLRGRADALQWAARVVWSGLNWPDVPDSVRSVECFHYAETAHLLTQTIGAKRLHSLGGQIWGLISAFGPGTASFPSLPKEGLEEIRQAYLQFVEEHNRWWAALTLLEVAWKTWRLGEKEPDYMRVAYEFYSEAEILWANVYKKPPEGFEREKRMLEVLKNEFEEEFKERRDERFGSAKVSCDSQEELPWTELGSLLEMRSRTTVACE